MLPLRSIIKKIAVKTNKQSLTPEQLNDFVQQVFSELAVARGHGLEIHQWQFQRFVYEYLGIEFKVPIEQAEEILWNEISIGDIMPYADKMLDLLGENGIRTAVISNIGWSGNALKNRINRLLPNNKFEFIIASSDYAFRKPSPYIFNLALNKACLKADQVWFCGDTVEADCDGANSVGIFPVW